MIDSLIPKQLRPAENQARTIGLMAGTMLILLLGLAVIFPGRARADWPWLSPKGQAMGMAALTVSFSDEVLELDPPFLTGLKMYPCAAMDCFKSPLEIVFTGPNRLGEKNRLSYVVLDLPPGEYRLIEVKGVYLNGDERLDFTIPLSYTFKVRPGRTAYLGRLNLTIRSKAGHKPFDKIIVSSGRASDFVGQKAPALGFDYIVEDFIREDGPASVEAMPDRRFFLLDKALMVWR